MSSLIQSASLSFWFGPYSALLTTIRTQGTNGAVYSLTAAIGYGVAIAKGEQMDVAKKNRGGKGGRA